MKNVNYEIGCAVKLVTNVVAQQVYLVPVNDRWYAEQMLWKPSETIRIIVEHNKEIKKIITGG